MLTVFGFFFPIDIRFELRLKAIDLTVLKKAIGEVNFARRQLAGGDLSAECRRTMELVPDALMKFGKTIVIARHYIQMQIDKLEKPKGLVERMFADVGL